ncbi:MAG: DNA primase [Actinomycetota bacterium]|nr:DNA primase [Actinomycetota bacterium]
MAYRRDDIERVRDATDLVELVSEVTKVKRTGRSVMAVCPFHQEKTASLSIDPARGLYHCFGCGKSGDLFRFVQETQALDFADSVELLARRAGITLERDPEAAKRRDRRQVLVDATDAAVSFYNGRLKTGRDAATARSYLRGRGYESEVVERFGIGYSPDGGDALVGHLRNAKVSEDVMVAAGLALRNRSGRVYDRFRGRVMFPIYDIRGDAVGFGARLLEGTGPKYLNSPETPIYHKSRLLYGLNWAKSEIVRGGEAVVVEGYTDVIALHLAGLPVAVATCGTALGEEHLDLLRRFTERVVLMFDADAAGAGASLRGFERSVPGDLDLRIAVLPEGRDPADVVSSGDTHAIRKSIETSKPLIEYRIEAELSRYRIREDHQAAARAVRAAAAIVAQNPDRQSRREASAFIASLVITNSIDEVIDLVEEQRRKVEAATPPQSVSTGRTLTGTEKAELEVLRLLLANHPQVRGIDWSDFFSRPEHTAAFGLIGPTLAAMEPGEPPDLGSLLAGAAPELAEMLSRLALEKRPYADADEVVRMVQVGALDRRIRELQFQVASTDAETEPEAYSAAFEELIALEKQRRELRSHE